MHIVSYAYTLEESYIGAGGYIFSDLYNTIVTYSIYSLLLYAGKEQSRQLKT